MDIILFFFIISLFMTLYSYVFYPVIVFAYSLFFNKPWIKGDNLPKVSIIISAFNEEKDIGAKLKNSLEIDYPSELIEIIVSSDGSTDNTNEIVKGFNEYGIILKEFNRIGKTACLNHVITEATGEIIVFTDANSMFQPDMLLQLVKNFSDSSIGLVSGWTKYLNSESGAETTGLYAKLEKITKIYESAVSSCVGADGAIFAMRKELYVPLGNNDINDFIIPLNVVKNGKRAILDKNVFCLEEETQGLKNIYNRQVRITTRTAWALRRNIDMLNISAYGSFSFFLMSHKVLRLLTPFFFVCTFLINLCVLFRSPFFILTFFTQLFFVSAGLFSIYYKTENRLFSICKYFLITFSAQCVGCLRMVMGVEDVVWTPKR